MSGSGMCIIAGVLWLTHGSPLHVRGIILIRSGLLTESIYWRLWSLASGRSFKESIAFILSKTPNIIAWTSSILNVSIVRHEHEKYLHAGPQATLAAAASTIMGNLPKSQINNPTRAFDQYGVDYAGLFYYKEGTKRNTKQIKCYIAVFICLATKAIHLELATSLSSEAFLNIFKRFVVRRGADYELRELFKLLKNQTTQQQVSNQLANKEVHWHFIPPRTPYHGGVWEAAIEAILNSRPITSLSSDPKDLRSLTPEHFLIDTPLTSYPLTSLEEVPTNRLSHWQHVQLLQQQFWRRWSHEYLQQCQQQVAN
ncbi:PREDICTED: uncharacterized protein LOC108754284 [Trachymyrmex septentrionalis]|uniref:uncharacterized protein LOC108754284 n=1 Tax=Trachymyrmex septentrionalis TaxID=34720 RepID=UPI00084F3E0B|nr:PREDICTED: uncharacterized protein LOC108754284 [Trachymyrmex septentrionalis]